MRKIRLSQIVVFSILAATVLFLGVTTATVIVNRIPAGEYHSVLMIFTTIFISYLYAFGIFRLVISLMPLKEGEIIEKSREEFSYHIYLLFFLIFFYPLMRSGFIPVPLMRLIYIALGARMGVNTYCSGIMMDPPLIEIGANTLIGQYALLIPHAIEGRRLSHDRIKIGNNVTIGAHAIVMSSVVIEDNAMVAAGAVVKKGTHIGCAEIWGGIPARKIKNIDDETIAP